MVIEDLLASGLRSPNAQTFVADGRVILGDLADAVHTQTDPGPEVETDSREFMRRARERFIVGRIGQAAHRAGMSGDQAAVAMARGEFDPFASFDGSSETATVERARPCGIDRPSSL